MGSLAGIVTGSLPGIHPNTVFTMMASSGMTGNRSLLFFSMAMGITHTTINHAPSMFIGIPDKNSALITLPGKKFVAEGRGNIAYFSALYGSIIGLGITLLCYFIFTYMLENTFTTIETIKPFIISTLLINLMIESEQIMESIKISLMCGLLGFTVFNLSSATSSTLFLPLFTGLFGIPILLKNFENEEKPSNTEVVKPRKKHVKGSLKGSFAGIFSSILPGIGPSATASAVKTRDREEFLSALGAVNSANIIAVIIVLKTVQKTRSGLTGFLAGNFEPTTISFTVLIKTSLIALVTVIVFSKPLLHLFQSRIIKEKPEIIKKTVIVFIGVLTALTGKITGIGILLVSSGIGIYSAEKKIRKSVMMSVIILPVLLQTLT